MRTVQLVAHETIFSWITRCHLRYGAGHVQSTCRTLLDTSKVRMHPYLPNYLHRVAKISCTDEDKLLSQHTLYAVFRFFEHDAHGYLRREMLVDKGFSVIAAHIPHSAVNITLEHSYCPLCAREQREALGFSYFDIRYQIPGVIACPKHQCLLTSITAGDGALDRQIHLPKVTLVTHEVHEKEAHFANFCFSLFDSILKHANATFVQKSYLSILDTKGYVTRQGHLRLRLLVNALKRFYSGISLPFGAGHLLNFDFLGPLLRKKTHTPMHPLQHLLVGYWLFEGNVEFYFEPPKRIKQLRLTLDETAPVDELIKQGLLIGKSLNALEKETGKSRCYIRRLAELNNLKHQSNRMAYDSKTRHLVLLQAQLGRHRKTIAGNVGVGIGYVEQVISNTPGLVCWRKTLAKLQKVAAACEEIISARNKNPGWNRKDFKSHCSKAFFYLYRNDRQAFERLLPSARTPQTPKYDWGKEDSRLFQSILALKPPYPKSLSALGRQIKDHAHLRRRLHLLPKTCSLLVALKFIQ